MSNRRAAGRSRAPGRDRNGRVILAPLARALSRARLRLRPAEKGEDRDHLLKALFLCREEGTAATPAELATRTHLGPEDLAAEIGRAARAGLVDVHDDEVELTPTGLERAAHVVRAHRLWETHLADETGVASSEWHGRAEAAEHEVTPEEAARLWHRLGHPAHDPHGDPIPGARVARQAATREALTAAQAGDTLRIEHLEDEPDDRYQRLRGAGLHPGLKARVDEASARRYVLASIEGAHEVAAADASGVHVTASEAPEPIPAATTLADVPPGDEAEVVHIARGVRTSERRRLFDLGIVPGTTIAPEYEAPLGGPTAYRVRGALIALRREQARHILVRPVGATEAA